MTRPPPGEMMSPRFWQSLKPGEFKQILFEQDGCLNAEQCARLWRLEERNSEPPQRLEVWVSRSHLERLIRKEKKKRQSKKIG